MARSWGRSSISYLVDLMDTIITDIDDTILNFADGFQEWVEAKGHKTHGQLRDLCSIQELLDCGRESVDDLVIEFSLSESFRYLKPEVCALRALPLLNSMGYDFVAISSCVDGPVVAEHRVHNIEEVFGFEFKAIHLTGLMKPKVDFLKSYDPSFWVEDNGGHAIIGAEMGHKTFLLNRSYNEGTDHPDITRVNSWNEIFDLVVGDKE